MVAPSLEKSPEIDGVMRSLETPMSELCDSLSDNYWRMIDTATNNRLDPDTKARRVVRIMNELHQYRTLIESRIKAGAERYDIPDLQQRYDSVLDQVETIIGATSVRTTS